LPLGRCVGQAWTSRPPGQAAAVFPGARGPAALVAAPYLGMLAYYVLSYGFAINVGRRLDYIPDLLSYALPFTETSPYSRYLTGLNLPEKVRVDLAPPHTPSSL